MEQDRLLIRMALDILESSSIIKKMGKERYTRKEMFIEASLKMIILMENFDTKAKMDKSMKEIGKKVKNMGMAFINGLMVANMKANMLMERNMEKGL